jgi:hypothetical protein
MQGKRVMKGVYSTYRYIFPLQHIDNLPTNPLCCFPCLAELGAGVETLSVCFVLCAERRKVGGELRYGGYEGIDLVRERVDFMGKVGIILIALGGERLGFEEGQTVVLVPVFGHLTSDGWMG